MTGISFAVVELVVVGLPAETMIVEIEAIAAVTVVLYPAAAVVKRISAVVVEKLVV